MPQPSPVTDKKSTAARKLQTRQLQHNPVIDETNQLIALRREKLAAIRAQHTAFPNTFRRDALAHDLQKKYQTATKAALAESAISVSVAGRIMLNRGAFMELEDVSGRIQLYVNRTALAKDLLAAIKTWDRGDIVGVVGTLQRSGKGDLYVAIAQAQMLTKSLQPLPEKHKGLTDTEQRYRQRYVDLMTNPPSRQVFHTRARVINGIRAYLRQHDYLEVETPMLQTLPGGATARPFVTHHNALDQAMYLRIAPELYLKRLVVGGFERVYEINRNFRNEGLSTRHNPEFTMLEFYQAYADYRDMMDHTEALLKKLANDILGSTVLTYQGQTIDLGQPFARLSVCDAILHYNTHLSSTAIQNLSTARQIAVQLAIEPQANWTLGKIQAAIFEKTVEHRLLAPTFITDYPVAVSPLSRCRDDNPDITERFELFIAGRELANGFSELNDPEEQAARFQQQAAEKAAGDDEAMHFDADYITALEYGLPPTAGQGIGIDRLVMLLTDSPAIRDVLLFPHMRPR